MRQAEQHDAGPGPAVAAPAAPELRAVSHLQLRLLDAFELRIDGTARGLTRGAQHLLAYLGLHPTAERTRIGDSLWPDVSEEQAQASLRTAVWRLRKVYPDLLLSRGRALVLDPSVHVDVQELLTSAYALQQQADPAQGSVLLTHLGAELLPGWYDEWVLLEREHLRQLWLHALEHLSLRLLARGRFFEAVDLALVALRADPVRESANSLLIRIHLAEGNRVEARRQYDAYAQLLLTELGERPGAPVTQLVRCQGPASPLPRTAQAP